MSTTVDPIDGQIVHRGSTNVLDLIGLRDETSGDYPVDANVSVTISDIQGNDVIGAVDLDCTYVANTRKPNTIYRAMLPANVALPDAVYNATFTVVKLGAARTIITKLIPQDG